MKRIKLFRIAAMALVLVLLANSFVFATVSNNKSEEPTLGNAVLKFGKTLINFDEVSITETVECFDCYGNCVVTSDLSNGDVLMWIYDSDGTLFLTGFLDISDRTLYKVVKDTESIETVYYPENQISTSLFDTDNDSVLRYTVPSGASTGARVGINALDDYGAYMASLSIDIYGVKTYSYVPNVDISGTYADFASFVGDLIIGLVSNGVIITPFAIHVLAIIGIAVTATYFIVSSITVTKATTTVKWWSFLVGSSSSGTVTGTSSTFTCSTIANYTNNTGYYYPIGSLRSHNTNLALACYDSIFPGANGSVSSWSNVW